MEGGQTEGGGSWILDEPAGRCPVIDGDGIPWIHSTWRSSARRPGEGEWARQALIVVADGHFIADPANVGDWSEVIAAGPVRLATLDDDLSMVYLQYPDGWYQLTPVGNPVRCVNPGCRRPSPPAGSLDL